MAELPSAPLLYLGDAAAVMRSRVTCASVDMVYLDPPFGNGQVWSGRAGSFDDRWAWNAQASAGWGALEAHSPAGAEVLRAVAPRSADRAYLGVMATILLEARRTLALTGTLWLHHDDTMGAQLRVLCDAVFGPSHALGLIIWRRTTAHNVARRFGRVHDTIAVVGRSRAARFRLARIGDRDLVHGDPCEALFVDGFLDDQLNSRSRERVGYPTQKPLSLLKRLIRAATLPGGVVLDPTCGSGTAVIAAAELGRKGIGIDGSFEAIACASGRLRAAGLDAQPCMGIAA